MNVVIDDAAEVFVKDAKPRRELGASCLRFSTCTDSPFNRTYTTQRR
jgi:hypothetical protein